MKVYRGLLVAFLTILAVGPSAAAEPPTIDTVLGAVVALEAAVPPNARTANTLGLYRDGYGVVIDSRGLILTIGYLILEADSVTVTAGAGKAVPARIVAYDHATGFGLLRAAEPLDVRPMPLADSAKSFPGSLALVAGAGGAGNAMQTRVVSRRNFAGYWEYLLEGAIFTAPPFPIYGGAALIDAKGQLIGIGSLFVNDAAGPGEYSPGNMFVPVNPLKPILKDLIASGRSKEPPRPWLGLYTQERPEGLFISRVAFDGPAQEAGVLPGSLLAGLEGKPVRDLEDFYRKVWAAGPPGTVVHLTLIDPTGEPRDADIVTADRYDWLKPKGAE